MRLRTRLALSFLFLAVVPLGAIVLYSYSSSLATYRQAVEAESRALAGEMEERLGSTRQRLRLQVSSLGEEPLPAPTSPENVVAGGVSGGVILADLAARMGESLPYLESLEFIPETGKGQTAGPEKGAASTVLFLQPPESPATAHPSHAAIPPPVDPKEALDLDELRKLEGLLEQGDARTAVKEASRQKRRAMGNRMSGPPF